MCVCLCVTFSLYIYSHIYIYMCVCVCVCVCVFLCVYIIYIYNVCVCRYILSLSLSLYISMIYICVCVCVCVYFSVCVCVCEHLRISCLTKCTYNFSKNWITKITDLKNTFSIFFFSFCTFWKRDTVLLNRYFTTHSRGIKILWLQFYWGKERSSIFRRKNEKKIFISWDNFKGMFTHKTETNRSYKNKYKLWRLFSFKIFLKKNLCAYFLFIRHDKLEIYRLHCYDLSRCSHFLNLLSVPLPFNRWFISKTNYFGWNLIVGIRYKETISINFYVTLENKQKNNFFFL